MNNLIVKHLAGSKAYGTDHADSDTDYRGIYCDPPGVIVTPWSKPRTEQWEDPSEEDTILTELHKYMLGYIKGSPNVIETLWVSPEDIVATSPAYEYLRSNAQALLSKKLRYTFGGYAMSQLKRIKGHNKWINNPKPKESPVRKDFFKLVMNYTESKIYSRDFNIIDYDKDHMLIPYGNNIFAIIEHEGFTLFNRDNSVREVNYSSLSDVVKKQTPKFTVKLNEEEFKVSQDQHKQYWTWVKERNEKRSKLEELYGYDVKHAAHTVRLLSMCGEVLDEGVVKVKRPDADMLRGILEGKRTYEQVMEWADEKSNLLNKLVETSDLPDNVNLELATEVLLHTEELVHGR